DGDGVLEVARPDAAIGNGQVAPLRVHQVEGELLLRGVVAVALLVQGAHHLDRPTGGLGLFEGQVRRQGLVERVQAQNDEGEREAAGHPVSLFHRSLSLPAMRRSSRQRYTNNPTHMTTLAAAR